VPPACSFEERLCDFQMAATAGEAQRPAALCASVRARSKQQMHVQQAASARGIAQCRAEVTIMHCAQHNLAQEHTQDCVDEPHDVRRQIGPRCALCTSLAAGEAEALACALLAAALEAGAERRLSHQAWTARQGKRKRLT